MMVRTRQQLLLDLPACLAATVSSSEPPRVSGRHLLLLMCLTVTTFLLPHTPRCRRLLLPARLIVAASTDDAERDREKRLEEAIVVGRERGIGMEMD